MKRILLTLHIMLFVISLHARTFYQGCNNGVQTLEEFVERVVPVDDQAEFNTFYRDINAKHQKKRIDVRQSIRADLQQHALHALEVKKPEWAATILRDTESKSAQVFLTRYGILQEYYQDQAQQTGNMWSKVVAFGKNVKTKSSKVISFFKRDKSTTDTCVS